MQYVCDLCDFAAYSHPLLERHRCSQHVCYSCEKYIPDLSTHVCNNIQIGYGRASVSELSDLPPWSYSTIYRGVLSSYYLPINEKGKSVENVFRMKEDTIVRLLGYVVGKLRSTKVHIKIRVTLERVNDQIDEDVETKEVYLYGMTHVLLNNDEIPEVMFSSIANIIDNLNTFQENGSNWVLKSVDELVIDVSQFRPFRGGKNFQLPIELKCRHGLINPPSQSNECFQYCVAASYLKFSTKKEGETLKSYDEFFRTTNQNEAVVKMSFLPREGTSLKDISTFEKLNPSWSVNVFYYVRQEPSKKNQSRRNFDFGDSESENDDTCNSIESVRPEIIPFRVSDNPKTNHMNLLLVQGSGVSHYALIRDFSSFMGKSNFRKHFWCFNCMGKFSSEIKEQNHRRRCKKFGVQSLKFPSKDSFKILQARFGIADLYFLVADFECIIKSCVKENEKNLATVKEGEHVACSYAWALIGPDGIVKYNTYRGENAAQYFIDEALSIAEEYTEFRNCNKNISLLSEENIKTFKASKECMFCKTLFNTPGIKKMLHHEHAAIGAIGTAGEYIGAACGECNFAATRRKQMVCLFHNSKKYDSKLIIQALSKSSASKVSCIAKNSENVLSLTINNKLKIIDSFAHLPCSLSVLTEDLKADGVSNFKITVNVFSKFKSIMSTVISKQFFPYEYINSVNLDIKSDNLPEREKFFSKLTSKGISTIDYRIANALYKAFSCKCLGDYMLIYNLLDVLLLADVWQNYRESTMKSYGVDPNYFLSIPSLSFAAAMIYTDARLEYINDAHIYLLVRESLRGGMVFLNKRFCVANRLGENEYNKDLPIKEIHSFDVNALYSYALTQKLPYNNISLLTDEELIKFDPLIISDCSNIGFLVCCDLKIPESLHDYFSQMPPCPEKLVIKSEFISPYQSALVDLYKHLTANPFDKEFLSLNLFDKKEYTVYHKTLQLYCKLGVRITKIHEVLSFTVTDTFTPYVKKNIELRNSAKNPAIKNIFKLMLNSFYGGLAMRKELQKNVKICTNEKIALEVASSPFFEGFSIVNETTSILTSKKPTILLDRFPLVATVILDLSKCHMYSLFYNVFLDHFKSNVQLLYVDTDCFNMEITGINIEPELLKLTHNDAPVFDFSNLPSDHRLYDNLLKGVPGLLKSEVGAKKIRAFVGLKRKMYSLKFYNNSKDKMRAKCLPKKCLTDCNFFTYLKTLKTCITKVSIRTIRSMRSQLYTILQKKIGFTALSTDRFILKDGINTLPYGHTRIKAKHVCSVEEA